MASRDERIENYYEQSARDLAERVVDLEDEAARLRFAWKSARRRASRAMGAWRYMRWREDAQSEEMRAQGEYARWLWDQMSERRLQRDRYRSAWLSARRRAADEANMGMEALEILRCDRDRWMNGHERAEAQLVRERRENARLRALLDEVRQTTDAPRLEHVGTEEDGATVWRLSH